MTMLFCIAESEIKVIHTYNPVDQSLGWIEAERESVFVLLCTAALSLFL